MNDIAADTTPAPGPSSGRTTIVAPPVPPRLAARRAMPPRSGDGFTLIELMITCAIIAILAAIAVPSYLDSVWKGKRGEAKAALLKTMQAEERFYTANNTYTLPYTTTAPSGAFPTFSADSLANSRYRISVQTAALAGTCTDADASKCVIAVATVIGNPDPKCGTYLAIDTVGNKISDTGNAVCWQ